MEKSKKVPFKKLFLCFVAILAFSLCGCATILSNSEDRVVVNNVKEGMRITTSDNVELPIYSKTKPVLNRTTKSYDLVFAGNYIQLHKSEKHVLTITHEGKSKTVVIYPKIKIGYVVLDLVCGVFPAFIDAQTGAWNTFDVELDAGL